jgi:SAM-dependent methyltransferase
MKLVFPATARNREPLFAILETVLPKEGLLLEVGSGSGEHCAHLAPRLPALTIQPSDPDAAHRASIDAWAADDVATGGTIKPALDLDVCGAWPIDSADAVLAVNVIHIAPPEATTGLLAGAATVLKAGGPLVLYGPYRRAGVVTAPSNEAFDADLKRRDPRWGLRQLKHVVDEANAVGFDLEHVFEMPANNLTVVFRRRPHPNNHTGSLASSASSCSRTLLGRSAVIEPILSARADSSS